MSRTSVLACVLAVCAVLAVANLLVGGREGPDSAQAPRRPAAALTVGPLRPAEGAGVLAHAPGAKTAEEIAAEDAAAAAREAVPACPKSQALYGRVLDGRGTPVPGAEVRLMPVLPEDLYRHGAVADREAVATTTSGADGSYLVGPAPKGLLKLRAQAQGFAPTVVPVARCGARVDLILDRGGALAVRVQDATGQPVEGALVAHTAGTVISSGTTDPEGRVAFPAVPTGTGGLVVSKVGHAAARRPGVAVSPGESLDLTVILSRPLALVGRVVTSEGERPVPGARVKVNFPSLPALTAVEQAAGDDGAFRFELAAGIGEQVEVLAEADEFAPTKTWIQLADTGGGSMQTVMKLMKGGPPIVGRVVAADGRGASGVTVTLAGQGSGKSAGETKTDDDGKFELAAPLGSQPGSWWQLVALADDGGMAAGQGVIPKPGERASPVNIVLSGSGRFAGLVKDASGRPLEGALVALTVDWGLMRQARGRSPPNWMLMNLLQDSRRFPLDAVTGVDGRFEIPNVPAATFRVTATHGLMVATPAEPVTITSGERATLDLTLGEGQTIEGRVQDEEGRAVAGAWVNAQMKGGDGGRSAGRWISARSQSDGSFVLRGAGEGTWTVTGYASGYSGLDAPSVAAGARDVVLRLTAMGWIQGVVYAGGRPYRGPFTVTATLGPGQAEHMQRGPFVGNAQQSSFNTDDGRFELRGVMAGTYSVVATTPDGMITVEAQPAEVVNGRASRELGLVLAAGASLRGTVTNEETRQPLGSVNVNLNPTAAAAASGRAGTQGGSAQTDAGGHFTMRGLAPGAYTLHVTPPSGIAWQQDVEIRQGAEHEVELVERVPGKLRITVVDPEGRPIAGIQSQVLSASGAAVWPSWQALQREGLMDGSGRAWERMLKTDENGVNLRLHVPPGRYRVTAAMPNYVPQDEPPWVDVLPARITEVTLVLKAKEGAETGTR